MVARWQKRWQTVRRLFPLTWGGTLLAVGAVVAFRIFGLDRQDLILLIVGLVGLGVFLWCVLATMIGALWVWWKLRQPLQVVALEAECGQPFHVDFKPPTLWWMPFVSVDWRWLSPEVTMDRTVDGERITAHRRGEIDAVLRELEVGDGFGIASVRLLSRQPASLRFLPSKGALRDLQFTQGMRGGDVIGHPQGEPVGDRIDMRRYGDGDPIRYILWKVYARSRELMVRMPERAFSPSRQTVAYLVAGRGDAPAAGAARAAIEDGVLGQDWTLGADGSSQVAESLDVAQALILRSAQTPVTQSGTGLQRFLDAADVAGGRRAMVFVPAHPGPWMKRVISAIPPGGAVEYLVCVDGLQRRRRRLLHRNVEKALLRPRDAYLPPETEWNDLQEVLRTLGQSGHVMIVDRTLGAVYPATQLQR